MTKNREKFENRKYLRGWQNLGDRYEVTPRSAQRMVLDGRLPAASYIPGSRFPLWDLDVLDEHDRRMFVTRHDGRRRPAVTAPAATEPEAHDRT
jgi:hypothetical protein